MKYALISEEQIKQLTEAVYAPLNKDALAVLNARAIIKSLKPSEPVATFVYDAENEVWEQLVAGVKGVELYAIKEQA